MARARIVHMALTLAAITAVGCRNGAARLEGHWKGTRADGVSSDAQAAANAFASAMELDVKGDQITVVTARDRQTGRYKVVREDKVQVVIVTDKDGDGDAQTFTFLDDKTMRWNVLEGKSIVFSRQ